VAGKISAISFFIISFLSLILFQLFNRIYSKILYTFRSTFEEIEEETNILKKSIDTKKNILNTLPQKCKKVLALFNTSQKLIELVEPEDVFDYLVKVSAEMFLEADNILLFIFRGNNLNLVRSFKRGDSTIKEKEGDIVDRWVVKHNKSILVDDLKKDFRFAYTEMVCYKERNIFSFIASPLSIGEKVLGAIRVESKVPSCFSLEDSRILRSIADIGTFVLERANLFKRTEELATKDPLTSLYLRDYFFARLKEEIRRAQLTKTGLGIIMLDIDDFKKINDSYGHIVGDIVLKRLAKILISIVGDAGNNLCRFGGEEFLLFIVRCKREELISLGEDIRKRVEKDVVTFRRKNINFTVSLGAVFYPDDGMSILELIDKADHLLYGAKRGGKNKLCFSGA
jgi:diguanylate cyclase (GGDEF)-like protein